MSERVLLVSDYAMDYVGGAQTALRRQAEALALAGDDCTVLAPGAGALAGPDVRTIAPRVRFTLPGVGLPVLAGPKALERHADRVLVEHGITAVIAHSELALAAAVARAAQRRGIPVLHTVHTFFWRAPAALSVFAPLVTALHTRTTRLPRADRFRGASAIVNALRGMTLRMALRADLVLSPSAHQAEALRAAGVHEVVVLSNVVLPARPAPLPEGPLTLLWLARFAPEKRLPVALDAVARVRAEHGPGAVHLHVAGGTQAPQGDVTFHGLVDAGRADELLAASHAALITSAGFDNQPMAALEAFARGRPVVVSDPVLAGEFGAAVIPASGTDAAGLAETIGALVQDRAPLDAASAAAAEYAAARTPEAHVAALHRAIARVRE